MRKSKIIKVQKNGNINIPLKFIDVSKWEFIEFNTRDECITIIRSDEETYLKTIKNYCTICFNEIFENKFVTLREKKICFGCQDHIIDEAFEREGCVFCGKNYDLHEFKNKLICEHCISEL